MKRIAFLFILAAIAAGSAHAQNTNVTGTIVDPNGLPYSFAQVSIRLLPPGVSSPVCGGPNGGGVSDQQVTTNAAGTFNVAVCPNASIVPSSPATTWSFTISEAGMPPPLGTGPQSFSVSITISGSSQDVSSQINPAALALANVGGGSVGPGTPTNVGCFSSPSNLQNCSHQITDTPGVGVNIPAPTTIGGGSGTASFGMPSGPVSGCLAPTVGENFLCSDGTNNTFDVSLNGAPYVQLPTTNILGPVYNIKTYGAICDQNHIALDTTAITAAYAIALPTGGTIFLPRGFCQFDNSAGLFLINNAIGLTITGEGKSSILLFNTLANYGWSFTNANGLTIKDLYFQYQPTRTTRGGGGPVSIDSSTNVLVQNNYFQNGNLSGLRISSSNNARVVGNSIANFLANGIFTVNNTNLKFENTTCTNNGDGCEEYSYFDAGESQLACHSITSTGMTSNNDNAGFIVNGCQNVSVSNFNIFGAGGFAINITQDPATTVTSFPDQVEISNGSIYGTGYGTNASNSVNAPALEINIAATPATTQRILLNNLHITHTANRALFLGDHNTVNLSANNLWVDDNGAVQTLGQGEAIVFAGGHEVKLSNTYVANANRYALRNTLATYFESSAFTSENNQVGNTSAASIRNDGSGTFVMNGVNIIDTYSGSSRGNIQNTGTSGVFQITDVTTTCTVNPCGVVSGYATGLAPQYGAFGSAVTYSWAACETNFGITTLSGASTTTGLTCLPANAIIDSVVYRITTTITTATSFTIGDSGSATRYCGTKTGLTAGITGTCTAQGYYLNPSNLGVLFTPNATPGAGAIRFIVYFHTWGAPSA